MATDKDILDFLNSTLSVIIEHFRSKVMEELSATSDRLIKTIKINDICK